MKISFVGHAAILIETKGIRILSDPWWKGPCFGAQWWIHPNPWLEPIAKQKIDFIYISHGHSDHLHPSTLRSLPKSARVIISSALDLAPSIEKMGFEVVALAPKEIREIAPGVEVEVTPTASGDTLMVVNDHNQICFNFNDAVHALTTEKRHAIIGDLNERYGQADYLFCGYGTASHFPNCYQIPGKDREMTAILRQSRFNHVWAEIVARVKPCFAFPFAADVVFFDHDLFWCNEPIHNAERPTDVFLSRYPMKQTEVFDIAPGFVIEDGQILNETLFKRVSNQELLDTRQVDIAKANAVTQPTHEQVEQLAKLVQQNAERSSAYLRECPHDYVNLIRIQGVPFGIRLAKVGSSIEIATIADDGDNTAYDVVFTTRFQNLRRCLTTNYGHEIIFVGSGGSFIYRNSARIGDDLHGEIAAILRAGERAPQSRYGDQPKWLFDLKVWVKAILGRKEQDLYSLSKWTVFSGSQFTKPWEEPDFDWSSLDRELAHSLVDSVDGGGLGSGLTISR